MTSAEAVELIRKGTGFTYHAPAVELAQLLQDQYERGREDAERELAERGVTWLHKIWVVHPETRIGRDEVLEAVGGRSRSWLSKRMKARAIPYRKNTVGELVFLAGEVRDWLEANELTIVPGSRSE